MAFTTYALVGERLNHLARAVTAPSSSPAADSTWPLTSVYDSAPQTAFRWGSAAADPKITVDLQMITNGGFETGDLTGWTTTGTVSVAFANPRTGTYYATISDGGTIYQDVICRSGEKIHVEAYIRQAIASGTGTVTVQNLYTGKYYNGSAWASSGSIGTNTTTNYIAQQADIVLEALSVTHSPLITIRITVTCTGGGSNTFVDDVAVWPWTDFCSVHGHKYVDPRLVVTLRSSTDNFSASDTSEATMTIAHPSFYTKITSNGRRYWQLRMTGTPRAAPFIGELVLGQVYTFANLPDHPTRAAWLFRAQRAQARGAGLRGGNISTVLLSAQDRTDVTLPFSFWSESEWLEFYREIQTRSEGGAFPIVLVPDASQAGVYLGMLAGQVGHSNELGYLKTGNSYYTATLPFAELPTLSSSLP